MEETISKLRNTAMGTKVAVAFANIFMSAVETEIISKSKITAPRVEKVHR